MKKKVCVAIGDQPGFRDRIAQRLGDYELCWMDQLGPQERLEAMDGADCLLAGMMTKELSDQEKASLDKVSMTQILSAGAEHLNFDLIPPGVQICSNVGGWAKPMAEHGLAMALCCTRQLIPQKIDLAQGVYKGRDYELRSLQDMKMLILGYGGIGRACAKTFRAMGCSIAALGRTAPQDGDLEEAYSIDQLMEALPQADLVLLALPSTLETREIIGAKELAAMRDDAILINLARGALIQKEALLEHLRQHPRFFAAIDAWWEEGRHFPAQDPLVALPNVVASAHNSNRTPQAALMALDSAIDNVLRFLEGQPLKGLVRRELYRKD